MINQQELMEKLLPYIEQEGVVYSKFQQVKARLATEGEVIETFTADGFETKNKAADGDYIVENMTGAKEQYIVKAKTFHQKYQLHSEAGDGWNLYDALGQVMAIELTESLMSRLGWQTPFHFEAPWNEELVAKAGDFLVAPLPDKKEIYRIARKEFFETYKE